MTPGGKRQSLFFLIGNLGVGGKERQLIELIHRLPDEKYHISLFTKNITNPYFPKIEKKISSLYNLDRTKFRVKDLVSIRKFIARLQPEIVLSWSDILSHVCLFSKPFISHPYTLINCSIRNAPIRLSLRKRIERLMYSCYPYVVANSYAGLRAYGQDKRKGRFVLFNGLDVSRVPELSRDEAGKVAGIQANGRALVSMVASLTDKKDHKTFIRSARACLSQGVDADFLLVGDGPRRSELEEFVNNLNLSGRLKFLGKRPDVETILKASNLSVLVSTAHFGEGISNTILESMACSVPVIATDSPGTREVIEDGVNGIIVPAGDHEALSEEIQKILNNPHAGKGIARAGEMTINNKFSMEKSCDEFQSILETITKHETTCYR